MREILPVLRGVLGVLLLAAGTAACVALAGLGFSAKTALENPDVIQSLSEAWFRQAGDSLTEVGFGVRGVDPADPLLRQRVILISEDINERSARRAIEALLYLDHQDASAPITLYLATQGGWLDPAFAIVDTIRALHAPVDTVALGGCFSAGLVILTAGTGTRSATPHALLSLHASAAEGNDALSYERLSRERLEHYFHEHARLPEAWFPLTGDESYYLTPAEALQYGLIDRIASPRQAPPRG